MLRTGHGGLSSTSGMLLHLGTGAYLDGTGFCFEDTIASRGAAFASGV
jgi:hypothetical protein